MSLRDRFRSHRASEGGNEQPIGVDGGGLADPIDFRPRFDGGYSDGAGIVLRFAPSVVQEIADGVEGPASGEYTSSGRFVVQRRFARPVVYTVLSTSDGGFTARRTDTNAGGGAAEAAFHFEPAAEATPET